MTSPLAPRPQRPRRAEIAWASCCTLLLACGLLVSAAGPTAEWSQPAKPASQNAKPAPADTPVGWFATYTPAGTTSPPPANAKGRAASPSGEVKAASPYAAFALQPGESVHPSIPAPGLSAKYEARITIGEPGRYRFALEAEGGKASITIYDPLGKALGDRTADAGRRPASAATAWIDLQPGEVVATVRFARAADAPARLRTLWERDQGRSERFRPEAIPTALTRVGPHARQAVAAASAAFDGRVLLGELGCISCHAPDDHALAAVTPRVAPLLGEIGRRAAPEWLLGWIADPQTMKPGSGMPDLIGDSADDRRDAEAIVHFLVSMGGPAPNSEPVATEPRTLDLGRTLYHEVGCVACHGAFESPGAVFGDTALPNETPRTPIPAPFGPLAGKWRPGALAEFLRDPLRTHPGGRMPSHNLSEEESDLIATYLITAWSGSAPAVTAPSAPPAFSPDPAKIDQGRIAFAARGCASCHQTGHNLPDIASTLAAPPLAKLGAGKGCLHPTKPAPARYTLTADTRAALAAGVEAVKTSLGAAAPIDAAQRSLTALGCLHCHAKDELGGVGSDLNVYFRTVDDAELGDEGRIPPDLTGVGAKLTGPWLEAVLADAGRARPYMAARMPQFGAPHVGHLTTALAAIDGVWSDTDRTEPRVNDELVLAGRKLTGEGGMNCISCHVFSDLPPAGTQGIDITGFAERLRYGWWSAYIHAPARFKPGTRMPNFFPNGKSQVASVLGGNPDKQADALWAYFTLGQFMPVPEGVPTGAGLPLRVGDRPTVFRTFLKSAGSRGIAVGFPVGVHFGFDAEAVRLVNAWSGDFIDATSAWKGRGGMIAAGQGQIAWNAPPGPALVIAPAQPDPWPAAAGRDAGYRFKGYRLDDAGVPTFLYQIGDVSVEDRFGPAELGKAIRRTFTLTSVPQGTTVWFRLGPAREPFTTSGLVNVTEVKATPGIDGHLVFGMTAADHTEPISFTITFRPYEEN